MARKATNKGTCQVCGRVQMLPGGRMAKHGYSVEWGYFSGTCRGSDELPFEQSTGLIEGAITSALSSASLADIEARELRADTDPAFFWTEDGTYIARKYVRIWNKRDRAEAIFRESGEFFFGSYTGQKGRIERFSVTGAHRSEGEVLHAMNERRAVWLGKFAASHREYAAWQRERIAGWAPAPLLPL